MTKTTAKVFGALMAAFLVASSIQCYRYQKPIREALLPLVETLEGLRPSVRAARALIAKRAEEARRAEEERREVISDIQEEINQAKMTHKRYVEHPAHNASLALDIMEKNGTLQTTLDLASVTGTDPVHHLVSLILESGGGQKRFTKTGTSSALSIYQVLLYMAPEFLTEYGPACFSDIQTLCGDQKLADVQKAIEQIEAMQKDGSYTAYRKTLRFDKKHPEGPQDPLSLTLKELFSDDVIPFLILRAQYKKEPQAVLDFIQRLTGKEKRVNKAVSLIFNASSATLVYALHHFGMGTIWDMIQAKEGANCVEVLGEGVCKGNKIKYKMPFLAYMAGYFEKCEITAQRVKQRLTRREQIEGPLSVKKALRRIRTASLER